MGFFRMIRSPGVLILPLSQFLFLNYPATILAGISAKNFNRFASATFHWNLHAHNIAEVLKYWHYLYLYINKRVIENV